ncbi:MAG: SMI1/KNR4 family protein [Phycisphaerales bacterium]|nr:SMI1/KNR4 family protein [Phycisphaerales bacterium]
MREFLSLGLPISRSWAGWRATEEGDIRERMAWPLEGMCFDIEHNGFWLTEWGEKPGDLNAAFDIARLEVGRAPALIPIFGHRYLPAEPYTTGNPVFSVYQTDVIYYGVDLLDYFQNEFRYYFGRPSHALTGTPRTIPFWSRLVS